MNSVILHNSQVYITTLVKLGAKADIRPMSKGTKEKAMVDMILAEIKRRAISLYDLAQNTSVSYQILRDLSTGRSASLKLADGLDILRYLNLLDKYTRITPEVRARAYCILHDVLKKRKGLTVEDEVGFFEVLQNAIADEITEYGKTTLSAKTALMLLDAHLANKHANNGGAA